MIQAHSDLRARIRSLYDQHAKDLYGAESLARIWMQVPPAPARIDLALIEREGSAQCAVNTLLAHLPPTVIAEEFGADVLVGVMLRYYAIDENLDRLRQEVGNRGYDPDVLDRYRRAHWCAECKIPVSSILKEHALVTRRADHIRSLDIVPALEASLRPGMRMPSNAALHLDMLVTRKPHMHKGYAMGWSPQHRMEPGEEFHAIYLDTPFAIGIFRDAEPAAIAGFLVHQERTLVLRQLQGVNRKRHNPDKTDSTLPSRALAQFQQHHALVRVAELVASECGFAAVSIQSAVRNEYTRAHPEDGTVHLPLKQAVRIYDSTAIRLGYRKREDGLWCKEPTASSTISNAD